MQTDIFFFFYKSSIKVAKTLLLNESGMEKESNIPHQQLCVESTPLQVVTLHFTDGPVLFYRGKHIFDNSCLS